MVARWIIAVLDWIQRHLLLFMVLFYAIAMSIFGLIGMATGDWDAPLRVFGWVSAVFFPSCLLLMAIMVIWPKPFREAAKELGVAPDETSALPENQEQDEKQ
jgi:hypothetical protein